MPAEGFLPLDRWQTTASGPASPRGDPVTLTWSLVPDGTPLAGGGTSLLVGTLDAAIGVGPGGEDLTRRPWFPLVADSFGRWSELGGLTLRYEPFDDGALHRNAAGAAGVRGDIRLAAGAIDGIGGVVAASEYPDSGDLWLDAADSWHYGNPAGNYLVLRNTLMHEIGHALGLGHIESDDTAILMEPRLQLNFEGPQLDDIRGLHYLYGDRFETMAGGNDSLASATPLGVLRNGDSIRVGGAAASSEIAWGQVDFLSIDSRVDRDYYAISVPQAGWLDILLEPLGGISLQGEVGAPQHYLDASAGNNLDLAIHGPASFYARAPARRAGEIEFFDGQFLAQTGTYVIEVTGSRDSVQLYQLQIGYSATIDEPHEVTRMAALLVFIIPLLKLHQKLAAS